MSTVLLITKLVDSMNLIINYFVTDNQFQEDFDEDLNIKDINDVQDNNVCLDNNAGENCSTYAWKTNVKSGVPK